MARDGSGVYSLPAGTTVAPNTPIQSSWANALTSDVAQTFNTVQPIAYGGTGAATAGAAADALSPAFVNVASGSTTNIGAATSPNVNITGTTTITAFDSVTAGIKRFVKFAGALTLTHNATSLILPGAANITTTAGDAAIFISEGSGNWRCLVYLPSAPVPNTLNGQYKFPATQNASSNVNTLDDYEEGTFTPTLTFGGGSAGMAWASRAGYYRKIGSLVTVQIYGNLSAKGSSTGAAVIGGLPFTSIAEYSSGFCGYARNFSGLVAGITGYITPSSATFALENPTTSGTTAATQANFNDNSEFMFGVVYAST